MTAPTLAWYGDKVTGIDGYAIPGATVIVLQGTIGGTLAVNASTQPGSPLAAIYSDPYGADPINQSTAPLITDGQGNFGFWALSGISGPQYYVLQIYGNGVYQVIDGVTYPQYLQGISLGNGTIGTITLNAINVKDYGAIGNGIHDDTAAILLAIAATSVGRGNIYFPGSAGTYLVSGTLSNAGAPYFLGFFGDGVSQSTITWVTNTPGTGFLITDAPDGFNFHDIGLIGGGITHAARNITAWSTTGTVATFTGTGFAFTAGEVIRLLGFKTTPAWNNVTGTVQSSGLSSTNFSIATDAVGVGSGTEAGAVYLAWDGIWFNTSSEIPKSHINGYNFNIQGFAGDGLRVECPIVSTFSNYNCLENGGCGDAFVPALGASGTSTAITAAYANANGLAGHYLQGLFYSNFISCAADSNACGYYVQGGGTYNFIGCGTEESIYGLLTAFPGHSLYINDAFGDISLVTMYMEVDNPNAAQIAIKFDGYTSNVTATGLTITPTVGPHATTDVYLGSGTEGNLFVNCGFTGGGAYTDLGFQNSTISDGVFSGQSAQIVPTNDYFTSGTISAATGVTSAGFMSSGVEMDTAVVNTSGNVNCGGDLNLTGILSGSSDIQIDGSIVADGTLTTGQISTNRAPALSNGSLTLTGWSSTVINYVSATNAGGSIGLTVLGSPSANPTVKVAFNGTYSYTPTVMVTGYSDGTNVGQWYLIDQTTTYFTVMYVGTPTASSFPAGFNFWTVES